MSRRHLWALCSALFALSACDQGPPERPSRQAPQPLPRPGHEASVEQLLGIDASALADPGPPPDPAPPAGNLRQEMQDFTTLEHCVQARAAFDPVVGDAIDALGYDTLQRDACRVLEAIKNKNPQACTPILASSLRDHCLSSVAIAQGDSSLCPTIATGHEPFCVALAQRDERLCSLVGSSKRTACRAVLQHDPSVCRGISRCERAVNRWHDLIPEVSAKPDLGTRVVITATELVDAGAPEPIERNLSAVVLPATVRRSLQGTRLQLGDQDPSAWPPASLAQSPVLSLTIQGDDKTFKQGSHTLQAESIELVALLPKIGKLESASVSEPATLEVDVLRTDIGAPVRFTLHAVAADQQRRFQVQLRVNTFVRDVVTTR